MTTGPAAAEGDRSEAGVTALEGCLPTPASEAGAAARPEVVSAGYLEPDGAHVLPAEPGEEAPVLHERALRLEEATEPEAGPRVEVWRTRYRVSAVPEDFCPEASHWAISVEWRGGDRWAVLRGGECLGRDGDWDYEPLPSSREEDWLATHRFSEEEALALARKEAPLIRINGYTPADVLERYAARADDSVGRTG